MSSSSPSFTETPWSSWQDWRACRREFFSSSLLDQRVACFRVHAWSLRGVAVPPAVLSTRDVCEGLNHHADVEHARLALAMCLVRLVNGAVEFETGEHVKASVADVAKAIGLPHWLVSLRHEATHNQLPSLSSLRLAAMDGMRWLDKNYWTRQEQALHEYEQLRLMPSVGGGTTVQQHQQQVMEQLNVAIESHNVQNSIGPLSREESTKFMSVDDCINAIARGWADDTKSWTGLLLTMLKQKVLSSTGLTPWTRVMKDLDSKVPHFFAHMLIELNLQADGKMLTTQVFRTMLKFMLDDVMATPIPSKDRHVTHLLHAMLEKHLFRSHMLSSSSDGGNDEAGSFELIINDIMPKLGFSNGAMELLKAARVAITTVGNDDDHALVSLSEVRKKIAVVAEEEEKTPMTEVRISHLSGDGMQPWAMIQEQDAFRPGGQWFGRRYHNNTLVPASVVMEGMENDDMKDKDGHVVEDTVAPPPPKRFHKAIEMISW